MKITLDDITDALSNATHEQREAYLNASLDSFTPAELWRYNLRFYNKNAEAGNGTERRTRTILLEDGSTWVCDEARSIHTGSPREEWCLVEPYKETA